MDFTHRYTQRRSKAAPRRAAVIRSLALLIGVMTITWCLAPYGVANETGTTDELAQSPTDIAAQFLPDISSNFWLGPRNSGAEQQPQLAYIPSIKAPEPSFVYQVITYLRSASTWLGDHCACLVDRRLDREAYDADQIDAAMDDLRVAMILMTWSQDHAASVPMEDDAILAQPGPDVFELRESPGIQQEKDINDAFIISAAFVSQDSSTSHSVIPFDTILQTSGMVFGCIVLSIPVMLAWLTGVRTGRPMATRQPLRHARPVPT